MKKVLVLIFLITSVGGKAQQLSKEAKFGLVTVSTGSSDDAIYQIWGHTVLHLNDPVNGINECYDYGTFSFDQPGFIVKFLRGTLPYQMAKYDFQRFIDHYKYKENRSASEQILNLSEQQKQDLHQFLTNNYLPENREYKYRFFYYNCASRIRDILQQVCKDSLQFSPTLHADSTYRQWIDKYASKKKPWMNFGMSLAIGLPSDEKTKESGAMFLPENLSVGFDSATIVHGGVKQPFVLGKIQHTSVEPPSISSSIFSPFVVFSLLFGLVAAYTYWQIKSANKKLFFDKIFFSFLGIAGWFFLGLWFLTDHGVTEKNMNVIWAFPIMFPMIFFIKKPSVTKPLLWIYALINLGLLLAWGFKPQGIPLAVIPIILVALIRVAFILKNYNGFKYNS
ncbi:MAG TPA: DUF4105 domain-containing protein [Leadbetterella sp.]|nr:DUF4105 domain-containing protein [Leadbetterella sp.]